MIVGRKRQHEEVVSESSSPKRRRDDSTLSIFDKSIARFGSWLRRRFGRRHHSTPSVINSSLMMTSFNSSESSQLESHFNKDKEVIIIDDDDDDENDIVTPPTVTSTTASVSNSTAGIFTSSSIKSSARNDGGFNGVRPMLSPILSTPHNSKPGSSTFSVTKKTSVPSTVSSIDIARKEQDRVMFKRLLDSKVMQGERKLTTHSITKPSIPTVKLYSVNDRPPTTSSPHSSSSLRRHQHLFKTTPRTLLSKSQFVRDPSITLISTPSVIQRQPFSLTTPTSSSYYNKQLESSSTKKLSSPSSSCMSSTSPSSSLVKETVISSQPPAVKNNHHHSNHSLSTSVTSDLNQWLSIKKLQLEQNSSDYQAKLEVAKKYAEIHQKERLKAEDARAEKLVGWMNKLKVRPWTPEIEDEVEELSLFLDEDTNQLVDDIWSGHRYSHSQVFSEGYSIKVKKCDLVTLKGLEWLNDEVINFYLNLVTETVNGEGKKKVHLFNSFFYPKLMSAGYSGVRRWTKKVDIFSFDLILLPIHLGMHWCLAAIDFHKKQIGYFDSLKGNNQKCLTSLRDYLVSEAQDKKQMSYDVSEWILECFEDIPEQYNGSDCGVFTCMYARHLARDKPFSFSQNDMPDIRRLMVAEIVNKQLL